MSRPLQAIMGELAAAGLTPAQMALVLELAAAKVSTGIPVDSTTEKRRAYDRERKRQAVELRRNSTRTPGNSNLTTSSFSNNKESPSGESEKKERAKSNRLPPEWQPSESHYVEGQKLGLTRPQVDVLAQDMRLWAQANQHRPVARKSNWDAAFLSWMRREATKITRATGPPRERRNGFDVVREECLQEMENGNRPDDPEPRFDLDIPPARPGVG